jgi:uncharacterized membrane protein (DUF4010 family)
LVLSLSICGHAATRILGPRYGLPVTGLAAGFVSSTAAIGSMAGRATKALESMSFAVAGSAFSTVATFLQTAVLLPTISQRTLRIMASMLAAGAIVAAIYVTAFTLRGPASRAAQEAEPGRAFSLGTAALGLATMMAVMLMAAAALKDWFGEAGVIAGATVAGIVDTHAPAISVASLVASGGPISHDTVAPVLAAMTSNALAKIAMAISVGSRGFALRIVPGIALSIAAAWAVAGLMVFR